MRLRLRRIRRRYGPKCRITSRRLKEPCAWRGAAEVILPIHFPAGFLKHAEVDHFVERNVTDTFVGGLKELHVDL